MNLVKPVVPVVICHLLVEQPLTKITIKKSTEIKKNKNELLRTRKSLKKLKC